MHVERDHTEKGDIDNRKQVCEVCQIEVVHLKDHVRRAHSDQHKIHKCDICNREYSSNQNLLRHKTEKHAVSESSIMLE